MSTDAKPDQPAHQWPVLSLVERRILGVMVEKAKTTPDVYPMSVNALVTGCNQKSNRDPVLNLSEDDVEETLTALQPKGLVTKITGGRVVRWRHNLYERWGLEKVELAILTELFLRGAQTEGELRSHASRMESLDDLDQLRQALRPMAERRLVIFLGPEGRRGTLIVHGFGTPQELAALRARSQAEEGHATPAPAVSGARPAGGDQLAVVQNDLKQARDEIAALRTQLQQLQETVQTVRQELQTLKSSLGA